MYNKSNTNNCLEHYKYFVIILYTQIRGESMNLVDIIEELQDYCFKETEGIDDSKDMVDDFQKEFLDGFIEIITNKFSDFEKYEVYLNIKTTDKIACPLLYKIFNNTTDAKNYYEELKNLILNDSEKNIINRCKIRV